MQEKAAALEGCLKDGEDQDRHLLDMPFSAFGMLAAEDIAKFQAKYGYLGLQFLPYHVTGAISCAPDRTRQPACRHCWTIWAWPLRTALPWATVPTMPECWRWPGVPTAWRTA